MGNFIKEFRQSLSGVSFESTEVTIIDQEPNHDSPLTQQDLDEVREHRNEVKEAIAHATDVAKDAAEISAVSKAAQMVGNAAELAGSSSNSASAQSCVNFANHGIADAAELLQTELPKLELESNRVTAASMEGVMSWIADAGKSVWNAAGRFFERVGLGLARLNKTSAGFHARVARVQGKMNHRKGDGGKKLSLSSGHRKLLILGDGYASPEDAGGALQKFSSISLGIVTELEKYMLKVDSAAKKELMAALINSYDPGGPVVENGEFASKIASLISGQPAHLLGNVKYEFKETREKGRILNCVLVDGAPPAATLVKHLDPPTSLTQAQVSHLLSTVSEVVTHQTTQLQGIIKSTNAAFTQIRGVVLNLTAPSHDETGEEVPRQHNADHHRLIRLEHNLVDELGGIAKAMTRHQTDLIERIDAVLSLIEESVFQD